eukprot:scaffold18143_cov65-Cyclotella_meneghiniana.AAC.3
MRQSQDSNANFNRDEIVSREQCPFQVYQGGNGGNASTTRVLFFLPGTRTAFSNLSRVIAFSTSLPIGMTSCKCPSSAISLISEKKKKIFAYLNTKLGNFNSPGGRCHERSKG